MNSERLTARMDANCRSAGTCTAAAGRGSSTPAASSVCRCRVLPHRVAVVGQQLFAIHLIGQQHIAPAGAVGCSQVRASDVPAASAA